MDPARDVAVVSLRRDLDETRISIARTVGELRRKTSEAMQWETYIAEHPASALMAAALLGATLGRWLAHAGPSPRRPDKSEWEAEAGFPPSARTTPTRAPRLSAATASWQRLAGRVEGLVNRIIDEVADATEEALVPALVESVRAVLDDRPPRSATRRIPTTHVGEGGLA